MLINIRVLRLRSKDWKSSLNVRLKYCLSSFRLRFHIYNVMLQEFDICLLLRDEDEF